MKITLSKHILPEYFRIADSANSHYDTPTNLFDFIGANSKILVVTIGESWTWGVDITEDNHEDTRLDKVYGRLIANELSADWLNLAQPGAGNFWIVEKVDEFSKIINNLNYEKVIVICTFTEVGRSFNSYHDRYINYIDWFLKNNISDFLAFLNKECINKIVNLINDKVILRIGFNFVDPLGIDDKNNIFLKTPWIRLINNDIDDRQVYSLFSGLTYLKAIEEFIDNKLLFKQWWLDKSIDAEHRLSAFSRVHFRKYHPLAHGHKLWANYILESLNGN